MYQVAANQTFRKKETLFFDRLFEVNKNHPKKGNPCFRRSHHRRLLIEA